jgi:carboxypeptidase Q
VDDWKQLHALPPGTVKGKILLFNHKFDKELAAQGNGLMPTAGRGLSRRRPYCRRRRWCAVAVLVRSVGGADFGSRIPA